MSGITALLQQAYMAGHSTGAGYDGVMPEETMRSDFAEWSNKQPPFRAFPIGSDTVELLTDGESITAYCLVCHPMVKLETWGEYVTLSSVIKVLFDHQSHILAQEETQ